MTTISHQEYQKDNFLKNEVEIILQKDTITEKEKFIRGTWKQSPSGRRNTYQTWYISRDYPVWGAKRKIIKKMNQASETQGTLTSILIYTWWKFHERKQKTEKTFEEILGKNFLNVMKNNFLLLSCDENI